VLVLRCWEVPDIQLYTVLAGYLATFCSPIPVPVPDSQEILLTYYFVDYSLVILCKQPGHHNLKLGTHATVWMSICQYPVSCKFQFQPDSGFNYLPTTWFWPDSENPYPIEIALCELIILSLSV